jgi:diguanylate cyclase (GGDEF)-like protein
MLHVDVLSGYMVCGASSLVAAALLRIAEAGDARTGGALRLCGRGFVVLGTGLLPAGFGDLAAQAWAQFSLAFGALAGMVLVGSGLGELQGKGLRGGHTAAIVAGCAGALALALANGPLTFAVVFTAGLLAVSCLMLWQVRGMVSSPRDLTERAIAAVMMALVASCVARFAITCVVAKPPPRVDLMYVPEPLASVLAVLYGVLPTIVATLLLALVNTRLRQQLHVRAITDELTGAMTRRALRELAPALVQQQQRERRQVAVLMLDLDRFKQINDTHGHATGDAVLRLAAQVLQAHLRVDALLSRYGGEEFVAIVPVEDLPAARRVAERLRHAVESVDWVDCLPLGTDVTISVGVAMVKPFEPLDAALQRADEALYRAKREGRNQCQVGLEMA